MKHQILAMLAFVLISAGAASAAAMAERPNIGGTGHGAVDEAQRLGEKGLSAAGETGHEAVDVANNTAGAAEAEAQHAADRARQEAEEAHERTARLAGDLADRAGQEVEWLRGKAPQAN